jgi:abortive infection bacteriophage resistance protein
MSGTAKTPSSKPWLSYADQVQLLRQRGLTVPDPHAAEEFLSHLNYYGFSGYCLAFENGRHSFNTGTTYDDVLAAYHFDLTLRDLLTEALEVIEFPDLPVWIVTEVKSFGTLSHMYERHMKGRSACRRSTIRDSVELFEKLDSPLPAFTSQWKRRVEQHLAHPPSAPNPYRLMGLTNN